MVTKGTTERHGHGSIAELRDGALLVSKEYIRHLWAQDFEWCLARTAPDFVWIGPERDEHFFNADEFRATFSRFLADVGKVTISEEEYRVVAMGEDDCSVAGRLLVIGQPDQDQIYAQWYRFTFVWRLGDEGFRAAHLHLSVPKDSEGAWQNFPVRSDTDTYRYLKSLSKLGKSRRNVALYDSDGTVHWVHPSQVVYLEAQRKRTIVHCMTRDIVVPSMIKDVVEMIGDKIVRVHRSYAVNRDHVVELKAGRLLLDDGTSIVVPAKRLADVRALLS